MSRREDWLVTLLPRLLMQQWKCTSFCFHFALALLRRASFWGCLETAAAKLQPELQAAGRESRGHRRSSLQGSARGHQPDQQYLHSSSRSRAPSRVLGRYAPGLPRVQRKDQHMGRDVSGDAGEINLAQFLYFRFFQFSCRMGSKLTEVYPLT